MRPGLNAALIALAVSLCQPDKADAQKPDVPAFEVASVKVLSGSPSRLQDGFWKLNSAFGIGLALFPGDGQRVELHGINAAELVARAYRVPLREVEGPAWLSDSRFDIDALIPSDQSRDKAPEMLLSLLQERFALKAHREVRSGSGYILSLEKTGPKLKEAAPSKPTAPPKAPPDPRVQRPALQMASSDMTEVVNFLAVDLGAPVEDRTGLKGSYDITIDIPRDQRKDEDERPAAIKSALSAYGLRLTSGKINIPCIVIDHLSKTPTPN